MRIGNSIEAFEHSKNLIGDFDVEESWCLALDSASCVIDSKMISRGTVNKTMVHPRDVFRFALSRNAVTIILVHNHPSLDVRPSAEDVRLTQKLRRAGRILEIPLVDHIILSELSYFSFADQNWGAGRKGISN